MRDLSSGLAAGAFPLRFGLMFAGTLLFFAAFYVSSAALAVRLQLMGEAPALIALVLGGFGAAAIASRPWIGRWVDARGRRLPLAVGASLMALSIGGLWLSPDPWVALAMRILQGVGYVIFTTAASAWVSSSAPPSGLGQWLAWFGAAANLALIAAPWLSTTSDALELRLAIAAGLPLLSLGLVTILPEVAVERRAVDPDRGPPEHGLSQPMVWVNTICLGLAFGTLLQFAPLLEIAHGLGGSGLLFAGFGVGILLIRLISPVWAGWPLGRALALSLGASLAGYALLTAPVPASALLTGAGLIGAGTGMWSTALMRDHVQRWPLQRGRALARYYLGADVGLTVGGWVLGQALGWGGAEAVFGLTGLVLVLVGPWSAYRMAQRAKIYVNLT